MSDRPSPRTPAPPDSPSDDPPDSASGEPATPAAQRQPGGTSRFRGHVKVSDKRPPLANAPEDPHPPKKH